jgi:hypothetical protein
MNETNARNILLIRAFETAPASPHWDAEDREWAGRSAAQIEGEKASAEAFLARRASLAVERLSSRLPAVGHTLAAVTWRAWPGWVVVFAALMAGLLLDAVSAGNRINILAPPILAILLWNIVVYLLLATRAAASLRPAVARGHPDLGSRVRASAATTQRLAARLMFGIPRSLLKPDAASPLAVFVRQWLQVSADLTGSRVLAVLHLAAAAFAIGALAGLYTRGLAFEYLAGWESTFLGVDSVSRLLHAVLGPASQLTGIALPDQARLAALRLPAGTGENAARWIHLYAVTVLLVVVVPRVGLGIVESLRARRRSANLLLPMSDGYFQNLRRQHSGEAAHVQVIPYSYQLSAGSMSGIRSLMQQAFGSRTTVAVSPAVAMGGEDRLGAELAPSHPVALTVALFSLSATPETENHAAFIAKLAAALPADAALVAMVDESAFLRRFGAASDRLADRRATWRRILATRLDIEPLFVSLEAEDLGPARRRLAEVLDEISARMVQNVRSRGGVAASA